MNVDEKKEIQVEEEKDISVEVKVEEDDTYSTDFLHKIPSIYFLAKLDPVIDVAKVEKEFSSKFIVHVEDTFGHLDYLWSNEGCSIINKILSENMKKIENWD